MPSFDIVSQVDSHELQNALDQANREISNRFDFKGTDAHIEQHAESLKIVATSKFQVKQIFDILLGKMAKREINAGCLQAAEIVQTSQHAYQEITVRQGIDQALAKQITTLIKSNKLKLQASIQGEQIRVTGKKRDDLQTIIADLKDEKFGLPLQFINFRD